MLDTFADVERALTRYADPFQPRSGSVTVLGNRHTGGGSPFHPALLDRLEERLELRRRMACLPAEDAYVLVRWYVEGARPEVIARQLARSARHVYRRRWQAVDALAALGRTDDFADADVAEFG